MRVLDGYRDRPCSFNEIISAGDRVWQRGAGLQPQQAEEASGECCQRLVRVFPGLATGVGATQGEQTGREVERLRCTTLPVR